MRKEVIAVDLGGSNLRVALVRNNKIIRLIRKKTGKTKEGILSDMNNSIFELINKDVKGIGIASPGPLKNGIIINPPNIPFRNFNMKRYFQNKFKIRIEVDNDANCVALAEHKLGAGRGKNNFFILTLGTGIGGGVVIMGKVYKSKDIGTELGNIYLTRNKTFEQLVGGKAISKITKEYFGEELNLSELMKINNAKSRRLLDEITEYYAQGIGSLINIFNPEIVVLAGGMREAGQRFLNVIRKKVEKYVTLPAHYKIVWSKLEEPGILGAALLID